MAAAVTYSSSARAFHRYTEGRLSALVEELQAADTVVGYNTDEFDFEVLRGYGPFAPKASVDIMQHLAKRLGFRPSLESVATATLKMGKTADGLQAVRWYRQGLLDKVLDYCQKDVEAVRALHEFGRQFKVVYYWDRHYQRQLVPVAW